MNNRLAILFGMLAFGNLSCGEPQYYNPSPLQVVYLPLDGARQVPASGLQSKIYFSDEPDESTVNEKTILVRQTPWSCASDCSCGKQWTSVLGTLLVKDKSITFIPGNGVDLRKSCLVMAASTALKGKKTAPLPSLGLPPERTKAYGLEGLDIGALQEFWTAE